MDGASLRGMQFADGTRHATPIPCVTDPCAPCELELTCDNKWDFANSRNRHREKMGLLMEREEARLLHLPPEHLSKGREGHA